MANRVTAAEVKEIMHWIPSGATIDAHITAANLIVTDVLGTDTDLSDAQKKEIERWLAAHIVAQDRQQPVMEKIHVAEKRYGGVLGKNLENTKYGQMVVTLDTTGKMAGLGKTPAKVEAIVGDTWDS